MKLQFPKQRNRAMTLTDVAVVVAVVFLMISIAVSQTVSPSAQRRAMRVNCVNNLKQMCLSFCIWAGEHNNPSPMHNFVGNCGVPEWPVTTNIAAAFQVMSNIISEPKLLICPADRKHIPATNWTTDFDNSHISYFLNLDSRESCPNGLMSGDDNFAINGAPVEPGLLLLSTNEAISWTAERHGHVGNLSFADGSVAEESNSGLKNASRMSVEGTPIATNRIVIP